MIREMKYAPELKESIIKRLQTPSGPSLNEISAHTGISKSTLYLWRQEASSPTTHPTSPHLRSAEEKLKLLTASQGLEGQELGAFLRREGVHLTQLEEWRFDAIEALKPMSQKKSTKTKKERAVAMRIKQLEAELKRKDRALAEAAALLLLSKKAEALWAEEDDGTAPSNGQGSSR